MQHISPFEDIENMTRSPGVSRTGSGQAFKNIGSSFNLSSSSVSAPEKNSLLTSPHSSRKASNENINDSFSRVCITASSPQQSRSGAAVRTSKRRGNSAGNNNTSSSVRNNDVREYSVSSSSSFSSSEPQLVDGEVYLVMDRDSNNNSDSNNTAAFEVAEVSSFRNGEHLVHPAPSATKLNNNNIINIDAVATPSVLPSSSTTEESSSPCSLATTTTTAITSSSSSCDEADEIAAARSQSSTPTPADGGQNELFVRLLQLHTRANQRAHAKCRPNAGEELETQWQQMLRDPREPDISRTPLCKASKTDEAELAEILNRNEDLRRAAIALDESL